MNYLVLKHQRRGIPSILAIVIIVLFAVSVSYLMQHKPQVQVSVQTSKIQLERMVSGNLRDNTATIYWRTTDPTSGYVLSGSNSKDLQEKTFDSMETEQDLIRKRDHVVTLTN